MELLVYLGNKVLKTYILSWLAKRLVEPSTWKGLTVLVGILGWNLNPELLTQIGVVVASVIGLIEVIRKEKP